MDAVDVHYLASVCADLTRYAMWYVVGSLVASGATWCAGYGAYQVWADEHPPPRLRTRREHDLRREASRGIAELELYLAARARVGRPRREARPKPAPRDRGDMLP
jgi:hypothetical protein